MQQPPNQEYPQQQWQQQHTSWGSTPQWQQYEPLPPQYPQQMPPPQWQQQPYYPPPYQPPEKPRSAFKLGLGIGCGVMAAFAIGIVVLAILVSVIRQNSTAQQQYATQPANQPTSEPTQTIFKIGETDSNSVWSMTLNSVKTSTGDQVDTPDAGMIYVVADVTISNLLSYSQDVSSSLSFRLQDSAGQAYDQDITYFRTAPDGPIQSGSKLRGKLVYAVPKTMHDFTLQFQENGDGNSGTWAFTV